MTRAGAISYPVPGLGGSAVAAGGPQARTLTARRVLAALSRARVAERSRNEHRRPLSRALTGLVCVLAGLLIVVSAVNARGTDLRPGRNTDLVSLVQSQSRRILDLARQ